MKKLFAVILAGLLMASLGACSSTSIASEGSIAPTVTTSIVSSEASATPEPTPAPTPTPEPTPSALTMGTEFSLGDWAITVSSMEFMSVIPNGYLQFEPTEGNQFLVVHTSVTNNGKESDTFLPSFAITGDVNSTVMFGDGYEFTPTSLLGYEDGLHDTALNPLSTKDGVIAFDVPQTVVDSTDPLTIVFTLDGEQVEVTLR